MSPSPRACVSYVSMCHSLHAPVTAALFRWDWTAIGHAALIFIQITAYAVFGLIMLFFYKMWRDGAFRQSDFEREWRSIQKMEQQPNRTNDKDLAVLDRYLANDQLASSRLLVTRSCLSS